MSISRFAISAVLLAASVAIAGCNPSTTTAPAKVETPPKVEAPARFVEGEGEPQTANPIAEDDPGMTAMGVVKFNDLPGLSKISSVRVFGFGSGDPAMNGLKVYLAFVSPHNGRAFLLGNFRDYRVIAASPGRIDLEYDEDIMVGDEGQNRTQRAIVTWTEKEQESSPNPEYPAMVTMLPAK
jgi:hypothetical protein